MVLLIQKRILCKKRKKRKRSKLTMQITIESLGFEKRGRFLRFKSERKKVLIVVTSASLYRVLAKISACRAKWLYPPEIITPKRDFFSFFFFFWKRREAREGGVENKRRWDKKMRNENWWKKKESYGEEKKWF